MRRGGWGRGARHERRAPRPNRETGGLAALEPSHPSAVRWRVTHFVVSDRPAEVAKVAQTFGETNLPKLCASFATQDGLLAQSNDASEVAGFAGIQSSTAVGGLSRLPDSTPLFSGRASRLCCRHWKSPGSGDCRLQSVQHQERAPCSLRIDSCDCGFLSLRLSA